MRPELLEYGYDDMLRRTFKTSGRVLNASPNELSYVLKVLPDWQGPLALAQSVGDAGRLLFNATQKWMEDIILI